MSEFDKHWNEWAIASNCPEDEAKIHFEAGQQSKQAEIDVLKAKLQELWTELDDRQSKEHIIEKCEAIIQELLK